MLTPSLRKVCTKQHYAENYKTANIGESRQGLPKITDNGLTSIVVNQNGNGFIAGTAATILRTREGLTEVNWSAAQNISPTLWLLQNYPDPFNASTRITFELAHNADVQLNIYDMLGRTVKKLHVGQKSSGLHRIVLNAEFLPSGAYIFRLQADQTVQTRIMVLQK